MRKAEHLMRDNIKAFLLASSLAFGIPTFVDAETPDGASEARPEVRAMRWLRQLKLSEAQRDEIFEIFHQQAAATREQMKLLHAAREGLRVAALSPGFDAARARGLADAAGRALSDMALMRAETMTRVAALLTPEQREKLRGLRAL
jgi:Spy/CpxP family protein refolding chaperone